jgi:hypothetical protein
MSVWCQQRKSPLLFDHLVATGEHLDAIVIQAARLPQSFCVSRKIFGMLPRAQQVFEIGNTSRGIQ